jgi:hypothetical protein
MTSLVPRLPVVLASSGWAPSRRAQAKEQCLTTFLKNWRKSMYLQLVGRAPVAHPTWSNGIDTRWVLCECARDIRWHAAAPSWGRRYPPDASGRARDF